MSDAFLVLARSGKLPSPSGIGMRILRLTEDDSATVEDIAGVIEKDPALTGRILRVANSAAQAGSVRLTSAKDAAMRLGMRSVSSIAVGFTLMESNQDGACEGFDYPAFWSRSIATATTAGVLARQTQLAQEAFTAGLLLNIGQLALATVWPEIYTGILKSCASDLGDLLNREQQVLGIDHASIASRMFLEWGMPRLTARAVEAALRHLPNGGPEPQDQLARLLMAASRLGTFHIGKEEPSWHEDVELVQLLEALGLDVLDLAGHIPGIEAEWRDLATDLKIQPLAPWDKAGAEREGDRAQELDGPLILAVDDDPIALKVLTNCLHRAGHRVAPASSGDEALALALQHQPAILITDWQMPGMDGLALCRALRRCEIGRRLFVIVLSGHEEADACTQAFDAEADDFIQKPFHPRQFLEVVEKGLRMYEMQATLSQGENPGASLDALSCADAALGIDAGRDHVTGLPNHIFATSHLTSLFGDTSRPLSIIALAIDGVAEIESVLIAQDLTRQVGEYLKSSLRSEDVVACTSNGRFLLLCPGACLFDAAALADRLRQGVVDAELALGGHADAVTISAGVAERSASTESPATLLRLAEAALELGSMGGPNQIHPAA